MGTTPAPDTQACIQLGVGSRLYEMHYSFFPRKEISEKDSCARLVGESRARVKIEIKVPIARDSRRRSPNYVTSRLSPSRSSVGSSLCGSARQAGSQPRGFGGAGVPVHVKRGTRSMRSGPCGPFHLQRSPTPTAALSSALRWSSGRNWLRFAVFRIWLPWLIGFVLQIWTARRLRVRCGQAIRNAAVRLAGLEIQHNLTIGHLLLAPRGWRAGGRRF
jgi:hypothetical protein